MELKKPLPASATLEITANISDIIDKGDKGAILLLDGQSPVLSCYSAARQRPSWHRIVRIHPGCGAGVRSVLTRLWCPQCIDAAVVSAVY